jgi:hypothetical protein
MTPQAGTDGKTSLHFLLRQIFATEKTRDFNARI